MAAWAAQPGIGFDRIEADLLEWLRERGATRARRVVFQDTGTERDEVDGRVVAERQTAVRELERGLVLSLVEETRFGVRPAGWARVGGVRWIEVEGLDGVEGLRVSMSFGEHRTVEVRGEGDLEALIVRLRARSR